MSEIKVRSFEIKVPSIYSVSNFKATGIEIF